MGIETDENSLEKSDYSLLSKAANYSIATNLEKNEDYSDHEMTNDERVCQKLLNSPVEGNKSDQLDESKQRM